MKNGSAILFFHCKEQRKTKIRFEFHFPMQLKIGGHEGPRIIALSLCLYTGTLQYTVHTSVIAAKIISLKSLFEPQYFGPDLRLARTKTAIPIRSVQSADCRPGKKKSTRFKIWTTDRRPGTKCRLRICTVFSSDT